MIPVSCDLTQYHLDRIILTATSGILHALLGNTRWALDFSHYILSEVFDLADDFESVLHDSEAFTQKCRFHTLNTLPHSSITILTNQVPTPVKTTSSLPLLILLSSMSRAFMRFICRGLRGLRNGFEQVNPAMLEPESRFYYIDICQALETSPVRVDVYEKFLAGVDSAVKHAYQGSGFGDAERPSPEKELLVNARIPPVLISAVETLLSQTVPSIRSEINRKDIVLGDYSWLGFGDDPRTAAYRKRRDVDVLMKLPLRPVAAGRDGSGAQTRRRRCVRCCEVSADGGRPRTGTWTKMMHRLQLLRNCACGGAWVMEIPEPAAKGAQGTQNAGVLGPGHVSVPRAVGVMGSG